MSFLHQVHSGAQVGADHAVLVAAALAGYQTGGVAPKDYKTEWGPFPAMAEFGVQSCDSTDYAVRTRVNIERTDATLVLSANRNSPGTKMTIRLCHELQKPCLLVNPFDEDQKRSAFDFLMEHRPKILNGAGNRESVAPGIFGQTVKFMFPLLRDLAAIT